VNERERGCVSSQQIRNDNQHLDGQISMRQSNNTETSKAFGDVPSGKKAGGFIKLIPTNPNQE